jgi:hypothetical protein
MNTNPFSVDWYSKEKVIAYAKELGKGMTVFRRIGFTSYSITHTSREEDRVGPFDEIVHRT